MSNEQINIRICVNFSTDQESNATTRFFRHDENYDTVEISDFDLRQLLLANGSNVNVEISFGDGHETRDAVGLLDTLGQTRSTLYARREPTNDSEVPDKQDIVLYSDQEATKPVARYPWHYTESSPKYGASLVTHNCSVYYLIWLTDLIEEQV